MPPKGERGVDAQSDKPGRLDFRKIFARNALADSRTAQPYFHTGEDISRAANVQAGIQYILHPVMEGMQLYHTAMHVTSQGQRGKYRWPYTQRVGDEQFNYGFTMYTDKTQPFNPVRRLQMNFGPMLRDYDNWYNLIVATDGTKPTSLSLSQHYGGDPLRRVLQATSELELDAVAEENRWDKDPLGGLHPGGMAFNEHMIDFSGAGIQFTSRGNSHDAEYVVTRDYDPRIDAFTTHMTTNPHRFREIQPKIVHGKPMDKDTILDVVYAFSELIPRQSDDPFDGIAHL